MAVNVRQEASRASLLVSTRQFLGRSGWPGGAVVVTVAWQRPSKFRYISLLELNRNSRLVIPALEQSSGDRVQGEHLLP